MMADIEIEPFGWFKLFEIDFGDEKRTGTHDD